METTELADMLLSKLDGYAGTPMFPLSESERLAVRLRAAFGENVRTDGVDWEVCGKFLTAEECELLLAEIAGRDR
jgi:hypothetical protein